jgi:hypothetical protein
MHPAIHRILISVASFTALGSSHALAQAMVFSERPGADTLAVSVGAGSSPWDAFYPPPPGAELVVPGTKPEVAESSAAVAGFTIQLSAAKGCDTSCHKLPVRTVAIKRKQHH